MEQKIIDIQSSKSKKSIKINSNLVELDSNRNTCTMSLDSGKYAISRKNGELKYSRYEESISGSSVKDCIFNRILQLASEVFDLAKPIEAFLLETENSSISSKISERLTKNPNPDLKTYDFESFTYKIENYSQNIFFKNGQAVSFTGDKFLYSMMLLISDLEQIKQEILEISLILEIHS